MWLPLLGWLLLLQASLVAITVPAYGLLGLSVQWSTGLEVFVAIGLLAAAYWYFATTNSTPFERRLAEVCALLALLLSMAMVMMPAQYAAAALNRPVIDPLLARADAMVGINVQEIAAWTGQRPALNRVLTLAYFSLVYQLALVGPFLALRGDRHAMWEYAFHFHVCSIVTLAAFAVFPAACAFQYLGFDSTLPQARFIDHFTGARNGTFRHLVYGEMEGLVSMPSFHIAGAVMVTWATRRIAWLFWPVLLLNLLLSAATVLSGAHYAVDTIGSFALMGASIWLWTVLRTRAMPTELVVARRRAISLGTS